MKFRTLLKFDSLFEYSAPAYDDRQISVILTDAQWRVFIDTYDPFGNRKRQGFEATEKRRRDLSELIKNGTGSVSSNQVGVHPAVTNYVATGVFYDLPDDFLYFIEESASTSVTGQYIRVKPIKHDEYYANIRNPYKKPDGNYVIWRMDFSRYDHGEDGGDALTGRTAKRVELISGYGETITAYRFRYLQRPLSIVCDEVTPANQRHSILDESLHPTIIDEAVKIMAAAVNPQEYQIKQAESLESRD